MNGAARLTVCVSIAAFLAGTTDAQQRGRGKGKKKVEPTVQVSASVSFSFGSDDVGRIRAWFGDPTNVEGLPPGLAKRDDLSPGHRKQLVRNGTLPPGLDKKLHGLPTDLSGRITRPPAGVELVYMSDRVLAIHIESSKILDVVADIVIPF